MANIYELQQSHVNAIPYLRRLSGTLQNNALLYRELGNIYLADENRLLVKSCKHFTTFVGSLFPGIYSAH